MLWRTPGVELAQKPGAYQRGMDQQMIFLAQTQGRGRIALARDAVGVPFAIHLQPGGRVDVREDQLLAATAKVE